MIDLMLFVLIIIILLLPVIDFILLNLKLMIYVKKNHTKYWRDNIEKMIGGNMWSGYTFFNYINNIDDPKMGYFQKQHDKKLKTIVLSVVSSVFIIITYIIIKHMWLV